MINIRPISDLRNNFAEITRDAVSLKEPIFLTKNGTGSLVVMSMECYEKKLFETEVYNKLREAELEMASTSKRYSLSDILESADSIIKNS